MDQHAMCSYVKEPLLQIQQTWTNILDMANVTKYTCLYNCNIKLVEKIGVPVSSKNVHFQWK